MGYFLHSLALATGLSERLARRQLVRRVFMLHGVGGPDLPVPDFEALLRWMQSRYRLVSLDTLLENLASGKPAGGDVALTFDDGLRNHLRHAYPVLKRLGIPATYFVCPGLIESGRWLWNHEARARLNRMDAPTRTSVANLTGAPQSAVEPIIDWMKTLTPGKRQDVEQRIRDASPDFAPTSEESDRFDPLAWDDFAQLDPALITIGSHTMSHPILPTLDDASLRWELHESRALLEARLRRTVDLFCYPNGSSDARVRAVARRTYRAAVTTQEGHVLAGVDPIAIPRIPVSSHLPLLAWRMLRPTA